MKGIVKQSIFIFSLAFLSLQSQAQQLAPKDFSVNGKVKNGAKGEKVKLLRTTAGGSSIKLDSTQLAADGTFAIKGVENDRGSFFSLNIADRQKVILLVEGGETFNVVADGTARDEKGNGGNADISGSKNMEYYGQIDKLMRSFAAKVTGWNEEYAKAEEKKDAKKIQEVQQAFAGADKERLDVIKKLLPEMGTSLVALFTANNFLSPDNDLEMLKKLADDYEKVTPTPTLAKGFIGQIKRIAGVSVGQQAPDFTLNSPDGKPVALSSLRGKFVLIDFWASWCGPCRMENPNVVRMYDKFKDKGFDIYGVSLDDNEKAWKTAIERDKLKWLHGSELKKWNSGVAQTYGVNAIPATFLIDRDGKIIAKNLRGPALESKLTELLGAQ
ncbi:peroxiredoxin family protein [Dyadobacter chenhuakuii]|uniref:TlpA family protein disulfide reductase n=1 Tax=Dyadobacter chenhuakuii TaxID=2909339 RepID=A0ABY4XJ78_9BACT|nr:TlpA disulfide reductase family protein [Dyadobacter chenhuakuii]MCF2495992.1 TlpA family protein disulfide reductase [Dyadobacter chenhuakuii]USJ30062.1 TlpA family protein disulfide reductase [Dyadobacter chenhuakuii]